MPDLYNGKVGVDKEEAKHVRFYYSLQLQKLDGVVPQNSSLGFHVHALAPVLPMLVWMSVKLWMPGMRSLRPTWIGPQQRRRSSLRSTTSDRTGKRCQLLWCLLIMTGTAATSDAPLG